MAKRISTQRRKEEKTQRLFKPYALNPRVVQLIFLERLRQQALLRDGKHSFTCATVGICRDKKLRVVTEELGDVAKAIDAIEEVIRQVDPRRPLEVLLKAKEDLRTEVLHVCATCFAWLEALEEELK